MVADMASEIEALRSLVYRTAWLVDNGKPFTKEAGMCKLLGSEIASRCIDRAVQIHGALALRAMAGSSVGGATAASTKYSKARMRFSASSSRPSCSKKSVYASDPRSPGRVA